MTTITIKNTVSLPQTEFESLHDMTEYMAYYMDDHEPKLTEKEIAEARRVQKEWETNPASFRRVT